MRLCKLVIDNLPGIEPGFAFTAYSDGVNIVTGPNAIGKSSLVRALRHLLAPSRQDPPALALEAEFACDDGRWVVRRNGRDIAWQRDGEVVDRPGFLAEDPIFLHRLSIESLMQDDASDQDLAKHIRRELYGNFDLAAVRLELRQRFARNEANVLAAARRDREGVEREYVALQAREDELPKLAQRIEAARRAADECQQLQLATALVEARDESRARQAAVDGFPPNMNRLRGDERDRLNDSDARRRELQQELRDKQRELATAEAALERTGLARSAPADEAMQATAACLRQLAQTVTERDAAAKSVSAAKVGLDDAIEQLGGNDAPPRLDAESVRQAFDVVAPLNAAEKRLTELREQLKLTSHMPDEGSVDRHRNGIVALRLWLAGDAAATPAASAATGAAPWVALGTTVLAALVAAVLASHWVVIATIALAAAAATWALIAHRHVLASARRQSADAVRRYAESELEPPTEWAAEDVRSHLVRIEDRYSDLRVARRLAGKRESTEFSIGETQDEVDKLRERCHDLADQVGFDPELPIASLDRFVRMCADWDRARKNHGQWAAEAARLDQRADDLASRIRAFLDPWRTDAAPRLDHTAPEHLQFAFDGLQERIQAATAAQSEIDNCSTAIRSLSARIKDRDTDDAGLYERAGLAPDDAATLDVRLDRLAEWKRAEAALYDARTEEERLRESLAQRPDLVHLVDEDQNVQLHVKLDSLRNEANEYESLIRDEESIRTELNKAGGDRRLEQALGDERRGEQALAEKRDDALLAVATNALLDDVEQAFEADHEPAVLRRARAIFAEVTAHAFDVMLADDGAFVARDARRNVQLGLGELSAGTRMQLLLALRLAWIENQERGMETMPLFLDEALTTSDEGRFAEMARSLERLAQGDRKRQIFYLCTRRHECALWQRATGREPPVIDLAAVRFPERAMPPESFGVASPTPLPSPNGHDAESYASLIGVPPVDPRREATDMHLFHALRDDLTLLHRLIDQWRVASIGQLEGLLASDAAASAVADGTLRQRLAMRSRTAKSWIDLWRQGRGRPVDRGVLEQSGAVSAVFIDRAADLAERRDGDGKALVAALRGRELAHFHESKIDELEQWLADEDYTDERTPLTAEERRRLTLQQAATADAADVNRVVDWLEASASRGSPTA